MDGFVQVGMDGAIQESNEVYRRMLGYSRPELRRLTYVDLTPERWHRMEARIVEEQILRDGYSDVYEKEYRRKDGTVFPVELRTFLLREHGRPVGMWAIVRDVTARKRTEKALADSESLFRAAFDDAAVGLAMMGFDARPIRLNRAICEMLGYPAEELLTKRWMDVTHPDDMAPTGVAIHQALGSQQGRSRLRKRYLRKDGGVVWADVSTSVVHDAAGTPLHLITSVVDVSAQKRAEDALEASHALFRSMADQAPVGIFQTDAEGRLVYVNPACGRIVRRPPSEGLGWGWVQSVHPDDRERVIREWSDVLATGRPYRNEFRFVAPGGEAIWVRITGAALRDRAGARTGYIAVVEDVTQVRQLREHEALAARLSALGTLIAGVADGINNPLAGKLAAEMLAIDDLEKLEGDLRAPAPLDRDAALARVDRALEALRHGHDEGQRLADLVKDLNLFGRPTVEREPVDLPERLGAVLGVLRSSLPPGLEIRVEDLGAPTVSGDPLQLDRVLSSLVSNGAEAARQDGGGSITVRLGRAGPDAARVEVIHEGAHGAPAHLDHVFEPFSAAPGRLDAGLALPVAHAIVVAHGGTLTAHVAPGGGRAFQVDLPAAPAGRDDP
jgi:PAS domain S-box-containing protein